MGTHAEDVEELSYGPENRVTKSAVINNDQTHSNTQDRNRQRTRRKLALRQGDL